MFVAALLLAFVSFQACSDDKDSNSLDDLKKNSVLTDDEKNRIKEGCKKIETTEAEVNQCTLDFTLFVGPLTKSLGCMNDENFWNLFDCTDGSCSDAIELKRIKCEKEHSVSYKDALIATDYYRAHYTVEEKRLDCCKEANNGSEEGCGSTVNKPEELFWNVATFVIGWSACLEQAVTAENCWARTNTCSALKDDEQCENYDLLADRCMDKLLGKTPKED